MCTAGDMVEGDLSHVLRSNDESAGFTLVGDEGAAAVWVEVAFPVATRVTELSKYTFSHGVPFNVACMPYGISDSSWFQIKVRCTACMHMARAWPSTHPACGGRLGRGAGHCRCHHDHGSAPHKRRWALRASHTATAVGCGTLPLRTQALWTAGFCC